MISKAEPSNVFVVALALVLVACGSTTGGEPDAAIGESDAGVTEDDAAAADLDGGPPAPCSHPEIDDDFSAPELDATKWRSIGAMGVSADVMDGRLTLVPDPAVMGTRVILVRSEATFDLTGCAVRVEVPRVLPSGVTGELTWSIQIGADTIFVRVRRPGIHFAITEGTELDDAMATYDETAHRWWRVREDAGVLYVETSADGSDWTVQVQRAHALDLGATRVAFHVATTSNGDFEGPQFDDVRVGE